VAKNNPFNIIPVREDASLAHVHALFRDYARELGISLGFQGFEEELAALPGKYAPPTGELYLATMEDVPVGCVGFYRMEEGMCELKRLYVRPTPQGHGIGKALMQRAIDDATARGYHVMRLDSLARLKSAAILYQHFGFAPTEPYNVNPQEDVYYMEKQLRARQS